MTRRTILAYHRIAHDPSDPYSVCVTPERFEEHLWTVREMADIVGLDQLVAGTRRLPGVDGFSPRRRSSRPQVALTFDDGYADNLLAALPVAEGLGVPFTVFVVSDYLGSKSGFWWDRLALLLEGREDLRLDVTIARRPLRISLRGPRAAANALVALHGRLRYRPVAEIEDVLSSVADQLLAPMPEPERARVMTTDELRRLAASPLVTVGAHTVDHVLLARRAPEEQVSTIGRSRATLEALLDRPIRHFAYPFGTRDAFDAASVEAVRRCGFDTACTMAVGRVTSLNDRFRLPRQMVLDWTADEMAAQLSVWRSV